jgi:tol-pal system protein YbgF
MVLAGCATREDLQTTSRELNETRKLAADLRTDLESVKGGDLSGLQKQLDRERRDIEGLNRRLDDQSAQISAWIGSLDQKLTGKLNEQTDKIKAQGKTLEEQVARVEARDSAANARVQDVLTAVGKKIDERLEVQDQRFQARTEALEGQIKKVETESRTTTGGLAAADKSLSETLKTVGAKLSAQADHQALALAKLEDSMKQMDLQTRTLSAQVSQFQGTLSEFSKAFRALNDKSSEMDRRTSEVTGKTGEKLGTLITQQGEQAARIAALSKTVDAAVATVNETARAIGELKQAVGESVGKLESRVDSQGEAVRQVAQRLPGAAANVSGPTPAPAASEPVRQAAGTPMAAAEPLVPSREAYERAYQGFIQGRYDVALTSFRNFLHQYPDSPLIPNAYFWSGECYFKTGEYARGIESYDQVIKNYPKSAKASTALYRKALALLELKDKAAAKVALREVIASYPKTNDSERARAKLSSLQ